MAWEDGLFVLTTSFIFTVLVEWLMEYFIYSGEAYTDLTRKIEITNKQLQRMEQQQMLNEGAESKAAEKQRKRLKAVQEDMFSLSRSFKAVQVKPLLLVALSGFVLLYKLAAVYEGVVAVKMPFEAVSIFQRITHRNLEGDDYSEGGVHVVLALCGMGLRGNVQKLYGHVPPRCLDKYGTMDEASLRADKMMGIDEDSKRK